MPSKTFDTTQNVSTPPAGKYADLETRVEQLASCVNDHATRIDANTTELGGDDNALADSAVSPAVMTSVARKTISIQVPDHATQTLAFLTPAKMEIIAVEVLKAGAGAGNTIQLTDATPNNITEAIAAAVDGAKASAATLAPAYRTLAAGATLNVVATRAAGTMACEVLISYVQRA